MGVTLPVNQCMDFSISRWKCIFFEINTLTKTRKPNLLSGKASRIIVDYEGDLLILHFVLTLSYLMNFTCISMWMNTWISIVSMGV